MNKKKVIIFVSLAIAAILIDILICYLISVSKSSDNGRVLHPGETYTATTDLVDPAHVVDSSKNVVESKFSLDVALTMLDEGLSGQSKAELDNYFAQEGTSKEIIQQKYKQVMNPPRESSDGKVIISNSAWLHPDSRNIVTIKDSYKQVLKEKYNALAKEVKDYNEINSYISEQTNGRTSNFFSQSPFNEQKLTMLLINILYLDLNWSESFKSSDISTSSFTNYDGKQQKINMMNVDYEPYLQGSNCYGFSKSLDGGCYFIGLLPTEKGDFDLNSINFKEVIANKKIPSPKVKIGIPALTYTGSSINCADYLRNKGITKIFEEHSGKDYINISDNPQIDLIDVQGIFQKNFFDINKLGVKAGSSVTVTADIGAATAVIPDEQPKEVILDRPFAFAIYNERSDTILFSGKVAELEGIK